MCVECFFLVLMYVFTELFLCFSNCHENTCAFLIVMLILISALFYRICDYFRVCEMFNIDVSIFAHLGFFCHFDIDVCIYSTCTLMLLLLLVVKRILILIMYSAASL